ncbi:MAG: TatD family hydrolase, partial [Clostridia bacterium]|nr:TatD family hydrolase [Clostridia bacterium]
HKKIVAIGEIGLDYYWDSVPRDVQKKVFQEQLILAEKLQMPVVIHDRDAHGDTMEILRQYRPKGIMHCFSGSVELCKEIVKLGMSISLGGVVTFKNARHSVEVAKYIPLDRLMLETDAPYLSPVPFRGKRCDSSLIRFTAEKIAEIKAVSLDDLLKITRENAFKMFGITP